MTNDPYYKDVQVNPIALASLPLVSIDISPWIPHVNSNATLSHVPYLAVLTTPILGHCKICLAYLKYFCKYKSFLKTI